MEATGTPNRVLQVYLQVTIVDQNINIHLLLLLLPRHIPPSAVATSDPPQAGEVRSNGEVLWK